MEWSTSIGLSMLTFSLVMIALVNFSPKSDDSKYYYQLAGIALWFAMSVFLIVK